MSVFFYAVPGLIMAVALFMATKVIRRSLELRSAWNSGLTAEARCLRSYTTTSGGGGDTSVTTTLHHVYEFTTREGRTVRFEEGDGPSTIIEGDIVTVHYTAENPEKATAHEPSRGKLAAGAVGMLVFCAVIVVFCIGFMVAAHGFFSEWDAMGDDF
jgi:ABC-type Fe3+ transport system permease subunit